MRVITDIQKIINFPKKSCTFAKKIRNLCQGKRAMIIQAAFTTAFYLAKSFREN